MLQSTTVYGRGYSYVCRVHTHRFSPDASASAAVAAACRRHTVFVSCRQLQNGSNARIQKYT